jgi:hypothetical protein
VAELLSLDGLQLNNVFTGGAYTLSKLVNDPPKKRPEWQERSGGDGAGLLRDPFVENRTIEATIEVRAGSRDASQAAVGQIVDKLEDADATPGGIPLVWRPDGSTRALTYFVLTGELAGPEISVETGYFASNPLLKVDVTFTCRPYGYEPKVTGPSAVGSTPLVTLTIPNVGGDVPAEAELIVTEGQSEQRDFVAWGLEQRYQTGADLTLTANELSTATTAGVLATRAGAVSGSSQVIRSFLGPSPFAVAGTGNQPHVGTFRPYLRCWFQTTQPTVMGAVRLAYRVGDGPLKRNSWVMPPKPNAWCELDLGTITVPVANLGTQRWQGFIESYSSSPAGGDTFDTDYIATMPTLEGFGCARRTIPFSSLGATNAWDGFNQTQTGASLTGQVMQAGGTWGTAAGDADDWIINTGPGVAARNTATDSATFGRGLLAGSSVVSDAIHQVDARTNARDSNSPQIGLVARWVDWNNFLLVLWNTTTGVIDVRRIQGWNGSQVASWTPLASGAGPPAAIDTWYSIRAQLSSTGRVAVWAWLTAGGAPRLVCVGSHADLRTGGALASGRHGLVDYTGSTLFISRWYDNYIVSQVGDFPDAVVFPGRQIQFRSDATERQDASGPYWGEPQEYRGAPFLLAPAGDNNLSSRVAVMARRYDIGVLDAASVTNSTTVQANWFPRWSSVPG